MDVSRFLSKVMGTYLIIVSLGMLTNMQPFLTNVNNLLYNSPAMFVVGFITLILGLLIVISHHHWQWNWRVIITLLGWLTLVKGISLLFFPLMIDRLSLAFIQNTTLAYVTALVDLTLGVVLCYFGFRKF